MVGGKKNCGERKNMGEKEEIFKCASETGHE